MYIFVKKQTPSRNSNLRKNDMSWLLIVGLVVGGIVIGGGVAWWLLVRSANEAIGRGLGW